MAGDENNDNNANKIANRAGNSYKQNIYKTKLHKWTIINKPKQSNLEYPARMITLFFCFAALCFARSIANCNCRAYWPLIWIRLFFSFLATVV